MVSGQWLRKWFKKQIQEFYIDSNFVHVLLSTDHHKGLSKTGETIS